MKQSETRAQCTAMAADNYNVQQVNVLINYVVWHK